MKKEFIQAEVDASYLYQVLAHHETDPQVASVFHELSDIEKEHALAFLAKLNPPSEKYPLPSLRARILTGLHKIFGQDFLIGIMMEAEKRISKNLIQAKKHSQLDITFTDSAHIKILENILQKQSSSPNTISRFEKQHKSIGGNALRAAVLGGNDGLVSNFSLIMGIAGVSGGNKEIITAGVAGLIAGALSMALGEWISVRSSQELYENQSALELAELEYDPEGEQREIALIFKAKGYTQEQASILAHDLMQDKNAAHDFLIKEELGLSDEQLGNSPMEAALASFLFFAIGAFIPLISYFFTSGDRAIVCCFIISGLGLFGIGSGITLFTGKNAWYSGFRQLLFGFGAAAVTYAIGYLIGVNIN